MFPRTIECEDCGQIAGVRGYGRIEYDWPETTTDGQEAAIPTIICVRLTVDCPHCGVKSQEFFPNGAARSHQRSTAAAVHRALSRRSHEVRFQRIGPMSRQPR
jgi:hypothetical protein